jgi:hypothetical protein
MKNYTRGASIPFAITFRDSTGGVVSTTSSASLRLDYPSTDWEHSRRFRFRSTTVSLTLDSTASGIWSGAWDSGVALPGIVNFNARTGTTAAGVYSQDGAFRILNPANLETT